MTHWTLSYQYRDPANDGSYSKVIHFNDVSLQFILDQITMNLPLDHITSIELKEATP